MPRALITGGFATVKWYYLPLKRALMQAGFDAELIHPGPLSLNIWPLEMYLSNAFRLIQSIDDDLILIGHSLGGIQSILLADMFPDRIKRVFAIGAPVWGCPVKMYEDAIRTLINVPEIEFDRFQQEIVPRVADRLVTISCENDTLAPTPCCLVETAKNYCVQADSAGVSASHLLLPYLPVTVSIIAQESSANPSLPTLPPLGSPA